MSLLTQQQIKEHVETDLATGALQRLMEDAENEIIKRFGSHGDSDNTITEDLDGDVRYIYPSRPVLAIDSVSEYADAEWTTLETDDYQSWHDGRELERIDTGTNGRLYWGERVRIVYTCMSELPERKRVLIDLVRLALEYRAMQSEGAGNYRQQFVDYEKERAKILSRLLPGTGII